MPNTTPNHAFTYTNYALILLFYMNKLSVPSVTLMHFNNKGHLVVVHKKSRFNSISSCFCLNLWIIVYSFMAALIYNHGCYKSEMYKKTQNIFKVKKKFLICANWTSGNKLKKNWNLISLKAVKRSWRPDLCLVIHQTAQAMPPMYHHFFTALRWH